MTDGKTRKEIHIVGAGVIGVATGLLLQTSGHQVVIIDPEPAGSGASSGNMGIISPDACLPVAGPGMMSQIPRWLLDPMGPLSIRWQHLPALLPWLVRFSFRTNARTQLSDALILRDYLAKVHDAYAPLLAQAQANDLIGNGRYLAIYGEQAKWDGEQGNIALRRRLGVQLDEMSADAVRAAEPALTGPVYRGLMMPNTFFCRSPERLVARFAAAFESAGGRFLRERVMQLRPVSRERVEIRTDKATHRPEIAIVAAGAFSAQFARQIGEAVPLESQRGYHAMIHGANIPLNNAITYIDGKIVLTPMENGLRIGGTVEFGGLKSVPNLSRAEHALELSKRMVGEVSGKQVTYWAGHRPCLPDSIPVISRSNRCRGVIYAFGHGHLGLTGAGITAQLVHTMVDNKPLPSFAHGLRHNRF